MWIKFSELTPDLGQQIIVRMDDGTPEKECFAIVDYEDIYTFIPANVESSYSGFGVPVLSFPVIAWRTIPQEWL